jgi:asparaginyl-tRNA synthetase
VPLNKKKKTDFKKDFFARQAFLTVSGQLNVEPFACSMTNVYTFGPTFRSEKSHTSRHLSEFWMIEPEMAFAGLDENMAVAEAYTKFCLEYTLKNCEEDLKFFNEKVFQVRFKDENLTDYIKKIIESPFAKLSYTEGIDILTKAVEAGHKFPQPEDATTDYNVITWGMDLASCHERYICETHVKGPVFLYNYPKEIKSFYMRDNEDGKTVQAMDMLVPLIGEVIGGSVREERYDILEGKIKAHGLDMAPYQFYMDLRKYGTVPHAGFGLGLERLIMMATGIENIRETIPYPRVEKFLEN